MIRVFALVLALASVASADLLRFPLVYLAQAQHLHPLVDPRNGKPSDEYTRYVMASQQAWVVRPFCLNLYKTQPNSDEAENIDKFYDNYSMKAGESYEWYHPTYVTDLTYDLCKPTGFGTDAAAIAAGIADMSPPTSNVATEGRLDQLPGGPLAPDQCAALAAFSTAHDGEAQAAIACAEQGIAPVNCPGSQELKFAIVDALKAWVATARNEAQRQLFDLIWTGDVHPDLPLPEFIAQKSRMLQDHMLWQEAFGCSNGALPDITMIQLHADSHGLRHLCMALDPKFSHEFPVHFRHYASVYYYQRVTCAQLAGS